MKSWSNALRIPIISIPGNEKLAAKCRAIAGNYRWNKIAHDTVGEFRAALYSLGTTFAP